MFNKINSQSLSPLTLNLLHYEQKVLHRAQADKKITSTLFGKGVLLVTHSVANAEMVCKCVYVVFLLLKDIFSKESSNLLQKKKLEVIGSFRITANSFFAIFNEKLISNIQIEQEEPLPGAFLDKSLASSSVQKKLELEREKEKEFSSQDLLKPFLGTDQGLPSQDLKPLPKKVDTRKKRASFSQDKQKNRGSANKGGSQLGNCSHSVIEIAPEKEDLIEKPPLQMMLKSSSLPVLKGQEEEVLSEEAVKNRLASAREKIQELQAKHERRGFVFQSNPLCLKENDPRWEVCEGNVANIAMSVCRYTSLNNCAKGDHIALNYSLCLGKVSYPIQLAGLLEAVKGPHAVTYIKAKLQAHLENQLRKWCKEGLNDTGIYNAFRNAFIELDRSYKIDNSQAGNLYTGESYLDQGAAGIIAIFLNGSMWVINTNCARAVAIRGSSEVDLISLPSKGKAVGCNSSNSLLEPQIFKVDYMANQLLILQSTSFVESCSMEELEETIGQIKRSSVQKIAYDLVYSARIGQLSRHIDAAVMVLQIPESMPLPQNSNTKVEVLESDKEEEASISGDYIGDLNEFEFLSSPQGSPQSSPKIGSLKGSEDGIEKEGGDQTLSRVDLISLDALLESQKEDGSGGGLSSDSSFVIPSSPLKTGNSSHNQFLVNDLNASQTPSNGKKTESVSSTQGSEFVVVSDLEDS